ncbi:hypothetical protein Bbelb_128840 [Branchiostoma belcheri]|nr:hypothetical protein Bbelb_128840 [Branchiostoma belcheri]
MLDKLSEHYSSFLAVLGDVSLGHVSSSALNHHGIHPREKRLHPTTSSETIASFTSKTNKTTWSCLRLPESCPVSDRQARPGRVCRVQFTTVTCQALSDSTRQVDTRPKEAARPPEST